MTLADITGGGHQQTNFFSRYKIAINAYLFLIFLSPTLQVHHTGRPPPAHLYLFPGRCRAPTVFPTNRSYLRSRPLPPNPLPPSPTRLLPTFSTTRSPHGQGSMTGPPATTTPTPTYPPVPVQTGKSSGRSF